MTIRHPASSGPHGAGGAQGPQQGQPAKQDRSVQPPLPPVHESWLPNEHPLYRPRHSVRQRVALICAAVFFLVPVLSSALGAHAEPFENRPLRAFPSLSDGWGFFTGLSGWATDQLPLRRIGVQAEDDLSQSVFGELAPHGQTDSGSPFGPVAPTTTQGNPPPVDVSTFPSVIQGSDGWLYLGQDVTNKCAPVQNLDQVIANLRRLRQVVESSGRKFELLVAPDKSTQEPEHLPASYAGKDCAQALTRAFWPRVTGDAGAIDLRPALQTAVSQFGKPLYEAKDTHWSYQGGLVMSYALANAVDPGVSNGWQVKPINTEPWPADIPPLLGQTGQRILQRYSLAPDGKTDRTRYEASDFRQPLFLATPGDQTVLPGMVTQSVGMIGDSFTQFASPFLGATFTDITIVHPETVAAHPESETNDLLADKQVIVVELAERNLAGAASPLIRSSVIDAIGKVLAQRPIR